MIPALQHQSFDGFGVCPRQVFLAYAASCFPNVGPLAQEEPYRNMAIDGGFTMISLEKKW